MLSVDTNWKGNKSRVQCLQTTACFWLHAPPNIIVFHSSSSLLAYGSAVIDRLDFGRWVVQSKSRQTRQVASALSLSEFLHEVNTGWKVDKLWHTTSLTQFPARAPLLNFIPPSPSLPHSIFFLIPHLLSYFALAFRLETFFYKMRN